MCIPSLALTVLCMPNTTYISLSLVRRPHQLKTLENPRFHFYASYAPLKGARANSRSANVQMASHLEQAQYIPLTPLPIPQVDRSDVHELSTPHASHEALPNGEEIQSMPLSRQSSAASSVSVASSQAPNQAKQSIKQVIDTMNSIVRKLEFLTTGRLQRSRYYGWRMGVLCGSCMSAFVLCCNIAVIVLGGVVNSGYKNGIADLMYGGAGYIDRWSTIFHLFINVGSTILLAASNYTMQVLCSPTRQDIDIAHANGKWFDIGLLSFRNLRAIPRRRAVLWLLLALSSIPLHLLYVFPSHFVSLI